MPQNAQREPVHIVLKRPNQRRDRIAILLAIHRIAVERGEEIIAHTIARYTKARDYLFEELSRPFFREAGIIAPKPAEPVPQVREHEIRLVTWMAVEAGNPVPNKVR